MKALNVFILFFCCCGFVAQAAEKPIIRMGNANVSSFDENWLFNRYGLQAD